MAKDGNQGGHEHRLAHDPAELMTMHLTGWPGVAGRMRRSDQD
jgi:hypothetical protein